jgi:hypothetical protein
MAALFQDTPTHLLDLEIHAAHGEVATQQVRNVNRGEHKCKTQYGALRVAWNGITID